MRHRSIAIWLLTLAATAALARADEPGKVHGNIVTIESDGSRSVIPGAAVVLENSQGSRKAIADELGAYAFIDVPPGTYEIRATAPGLTGSTSAAIKGGEALAIDVLMSVEAVKESVTVSANAEPQISTEPEGSTEITRTTILNTPSRDDRSDTLLPLIPGVVRGPDGFINMKGGRSSQGGSLLNSASIVDPVTGNSAMTLPIDVVQSATVIANPYDPEYGRLAGAVAKIETTTSNFDRFHASVQNVFVRPRKRDDHFVGVESATPRATITGPLFNNKLAFTESFEYRFIRTPVESLPPLERDMKFEGFTSFNQLDANLNSRQSMTVNFTLSPQKLNYLGLNTFTPQPSTPDLHQRGYMGYLQHRLTLSSDSILVSQVSYKQLDIDVTPNSTDPYQLLVETTRGGFFDRQDRDSQHTEWHETYQFAKRDFTGYHQLKAGIDYIHDKYDGRIAFEPVSILGVSNLPVEQIQFGKPSRFGITEDGLAWFVADHWQPAQLISIDLGLRFDRDSVTDSVTAAPRSGFALRLTRDAKTVLKGGIGLFYDRVPLNVASFPLLPDRTISTLTPTGGVWNQQLLVNTFAAGLKNPRSVGWNLELDRQVTRALTVRAGFQQRNTARDFVLGPKADLGMLSLSNYGRSFYREFQVTGQYKLRRGTVNASYVRSKAFGNLNDFNQFFGNNANAVINPDSQGRLGFDAPNRVLGWGQWDAPFRLTVMPVLDIHTGFPYSITNEYRDFVGPRNTERLPRFAALDLQVTRPIRIHFGPERLKARVGFSVFNLLNHFNPRDVQTDVDSYRYGAMFNGVGRTWRGKFVVEF